MDVYTERSYLVAYLAVKYPAVMSYNDPNEPDWPVIYIESPEGQLSWHIAPHDVEIFSHVKKVEPEEITWDGHSTELKYERILRLIRNANGFE